VDLVQHFGCSEKSFRIPGIAKVFEEYQKQHSIKVNYQFLPSEHFVALFTAAQNSNQEIDVIFLNGQDT
jgi:ABC-type glycerol-3-phosphate transport system substrate-binding protein